MRFIPAVPPSTISKGPTASATRYEGNGFVVANAWRTHPARPGTSPALVSGELLTTTCFAGASITSVHGVFHPGSSKHGKVRRALVSSCWEIT